MLDAMSLGLPGNNLHVVRGKKTYSTVNKIDLLPSFLLPPPFTTPPKYFGHIYHIPIVEPSQSPTLTCRPSCLSRDLGSIVTAMYHSYTRFQAAL